MSEASETARRLIEAIGTDMSAVADLYAEHVVIEMPFAAPLFPLTQEVTREQLRAGFTRADGPRYSGVSDVRIHETAEPNVAVLEYRLHGHDATGDRAFALDYIMVITTEGGLVVHSRDYSSPVQAAQSMGITEQLAIALGATS